MEEITSITLNNIKEMQIPSQCTGTWMSDTAFKLLSFWYRCQQFLVNGSHVSATYPHQQTQKMKTESYGITSENRKWPRCTLEVLTIVSHLESREVLLEAWFPVQTCIAREDLEGIFLEEIVGRVRFSQDSDGDFGKGGPRGK